MSEKVIRFSHDLLVFSGLDLEPSKVGTVRLESSTNNARLILVVTKNLDSSMGEIVPPDEPKKRGGVYLYHPHAIAQDIVNLANETYQISRMSSSEAILVDCLGYEASPPNGKRVWFEPSMKEALNFLTATASIS